MGNRRSFSKNMSNCYIPSEDDDSYLLAHPVTGGGTRSQFSYKQKMFFALREALLSTSHLANCLHIFFPFIRILYRNSTLPKDDVLLLNF